MIVPRNQLLWAVGACAVPAGLLSAAVGVVNELDAGSTARVVHAAAVLGWALAGLVLAAAVVDLALCWGRLHGIDTGVPAIVRLTRGREGVVPVRFRNRDQQRITLRLGLAFSRDLCAEDPDQTLDVVLPADHEEAVFDWRCTPLRRGRHTIHACCLERPSPLGFWDVRARLHVDADLRVYPDLAAERRGLAAVFLNSRGIGAHAQRLVGKGRDFEKLREYIPGDSYLDIHWRASAKRGQPVTKIYQMERTQQVYVVLDTSRLSARPAGRRGDATQLERFLKAALILGQAAQRQGDNFGLVSFNNHVETFIRARNGATHFGICRDAIFDAVSRAVSPDFDELTAFIRSRLTKRALLVFLTSLDDPVLAESFTQHIRLVCDQHLVLVNMIRAPEVAPLFSRPDVASTEDLYRSLGGHYRYQELRELERVLQREGVTLKSVDSAGLCPEVVSQYMNIKQRQLL